jgi:hypothetical protein
MKKILFLSLIIMLIFGLSGCDDSSQTNGTSTPFAGGKTALVMSFIEGAPPNEIFDNGNFPFSINIKLENKGEHSIQEADGYIEITGIDAQEFGFSSQQDLKKDMDYEIKGVRKNSEGTILIGDTIIAEFNGLNYIPNIRGNFDSRIRATACYNYVTEATTNACLKRDMISNTNSEEICEVSGVKTVFNSAGPVQVSKVSQTPLGSDKIQLTFEISHVGEANDRIYKKDSVCQDVQTNQERNLIYFELLDTSGNIMSEASCSGLRDASGSSEGYVELFNRQPRTIVCSFDVSEIEGVFEKRINARLSYRYSQFIEKSILVKDVSAND